MIIFDNHLHLREDGRFLEAVKDFKNAGGTHFILCQYPMTKQVIKDKKYLNVYKKTLQMRKKIVEKTQIQVFVTVGPYPVDFLKLSKKFSQKKATEIMKKGMDEAANLCMENDYVVGIGEIGRPHFQLKQEILDKSNEILKYGMKKAKEIDVPVIIHTETTTPDQCLELKKMGEKVGLPASKIVKHFSPPLIYERENHGLMPSVLASKKNIYQAAKKGTRFMMETDYIDDPKRPGAVLGPKTVPKRTKKLLKNNILNEEQLTKIHKTNPEKTYNIELKEK
ncbi:MAG: TatD family hydrolase [Candidatus Thermoplasmatota archaeon]